MKYKLAIALLALVPLVSGCVKDYDSSFLDQAKAKNWTREQQRVALYYSYRLLFLKKGEDGTFAVVYSRLPREEVIKQLEKNLKDLQDILDYRNDQMNSFIKTFGLRPYLERKEFILKAVLARVLASENDRKLKEYLGEVNSTMHDGIDPSKGYDEKVLTIVDLKDAYPFTSKVVEEARASGLLKEIGRTSKTDVESMYRKEYDPNDPNDPNKFVWESKTVGYDLVKYKIMVAGEVPKNNDPNYVEIWRVVDGKRESMPALKAFIDNGQAVIVLDSDREAEKIGFGLPNVVDRVSVSDLYGEQMIARLFPDAKKGRVEPKTPPIRVEIARAGAPVDTWEKCPEPDGCRVPTSFKREPALDNYNVRVTLKPNKQDSTDTSKVIEYIAKEWTNGSNEFSWSSAKVIEYYKPSAKYRGPVADAKVMNMESKKKLQITWADGREESGIVTPKGSVFIEEKPEKMSFSVGEERWMVWDSDGDGKFDKRRRISPSMKYDIGMYPYTPSSSSYGEFDR